MIKREWKNLRSKQGPKAKTQHQAAMDRHRVIEPTKQKKATTLPTWLPTKQKKATTLPTWLSSLLSVYACSRQQHANRCSNLLSPRQHRSLPTLWVVCRTCWNDKAWREPPLNVWKRQVTKKKCALSYYDGINKTIVLS